MKKLELRKLIREEIRVLKEATKTALTTENEIKQWLDKMKIKNYVINKDLTVDVNGDVDISNKNLKKIPIQFNTVKGFFNCSNNELISLKGSPKIVKDGFYCTDCGLTSLKYGPKKVGFMFKCNNNRLTSLDGCPKEVGKDFWCYYNKVKFANHEVRDRCVVKGRVSN